MLDEVFVLCRRLANGPLIKSLDEDRPRDTQHTNQQQKKRIAITHLTMGHWWVMVFWHQVGAKIGLTKFAARVRREMR